MEEKLNQVEATQANRGLGVKWVLLIGTAVAAVGMLGVYAFWV